MKRLRFYNDLQEGFIIWENTLADWEWTLGVNLWGIIYGIRAFVPRMLEQDTEGHIVNTASVAGLTSGPGLGIYKVTKHGVVTLSETLYHELALRGAKVKASVLCPGFVNTGGYSSRAQADVYSRSIITDEEVLYMKLRRILRD